MIERLKDRLSNHRKGMALILSGLAIAGCGDSLSANRAAVTTCNDKAYDVAAGQIDTNPSSMLATASRHVIVLHRRAEQQNGSIDLSRYIGVTEITATPSELTLSFKRPNPEGWPAPSSFVDEVHFPVEKDKAQIAAGAILCFTANGLESNGTYATLQQYVHETAPLSH